MDELLTAAPTRTDIRDARAFMARFSDQRVESRRAAEVECSATAEGIVLPLSVNGKDRPLAHGHRLQQRGANESEARMLGLTVAAGGVTGDMQGGTAPARTAVADRMTIGDTVLRDVPLIVYPDTQPPWNELPAGRRGALGLPVAVALQTIGWTTSHTCQIGAENSVAAGPRANLAFDQASLIARARFGARPLDFVLDTGNQGGTQLWSRFARDFPALIRDQGRKSTKTLHQIGGAKQQDIVVLPGGASGHWHVRRGASTGGSLRPVRRRRRASREPGDGRAWTGQSRHHRFEGHAPDAALTDPAAAGRRTIRPILHPQAEASMVKRAGLVALVVALAASVGFVVVRGQDGRAADLVVHEWGTFTSVAGPDGQAVPWHPLSGSSDLPCFVRLLNPGDVKVVLNVDSGNPATGWLTGTARPRADGDTGPVLLLAARDER